MFFRPGHVSVSGPGSTRPAWNGPKYSKVADAVLQDLEKRPSRGTSVVRAGVGLSSATASTCGIVDDGVAAPPEVGNERRSDNQQDEEGIVSAASSRVGADGSDE